MERGTDSRTCGWYLGQDGQFILIHWYNGTPFSPTKTHVITGMIPLTFDIIKKRINKKEMRDIPEIDELHSCDYDSQEGRHVFEF